MTTGSIARRALAEILGCRLGLCVLTLAFAALAPAQDRRQSTVTLFEGPRLIVDADRSPIEDAALLVDNGRIVRAGRRQDVQSPEGATRVDLRGKTVMPAIVDAHVHLGYQRGAVFAAENFTRV